MLCMYTFNRNTNLEEPTFCAFFLILKSLKINFSEFIKIYLTCYHDNYNFNIIYLYFIYIYYTTKLIVETKKIIEKITLIKYF